MKKLIVTRGDDVIKSQTDISIPIIQKYAGKIGADFRLLDHDLSHIPCLKGNLGRFHARIFKLHDLFDKYDRICHIDADVIVCPACPNIFNEVPYEKVGTVFEDKGNRRADRLNRIIKIQALWGDVGWTNDYMNTGFCIFSKCHKSIFDCGNVYYTGPGYDDMQIMYKIKEMKIPVHELSWNWNAMSMWFDGVDNKYKKLNEAYAVHHAGAGHTWLTKDRIKQMHMIKDILCLK
tara:strand:- start:15748 stop:16449 length:702 start_codon:yes stop_codon:yes gene_type:complete